MAATKSVAQGTDTPADDAPRDYEKPDHAALGYLTGMVRKHPGLRLSWRSDGDSAHAEVFRQCLRAAPVAEALSDRRRTRQGPFLERLFRAARRRIEDDDELLAGAWGYLTREPGWQALPKSARLLCEALHAMAAEPGAMGGPYVLCCHTLAIALIHSRTGRRYSKGAITKARVIAIEAGFLGAEVGSPHEKGARPKATVYNLLPEALKSELVDPPHHLLVHFSAERPVLSAQDRATVRWVIAGLRDNHDATERRVLGLQPRKAPKPEPAQAAALGWAEPAHPAPRQEAAASFDEVMAAESEPEAGAPAPPAAQVPAARPVLLEDDLVIPDVEADFLAECMAAEGSGVFKDEEVIASGGLPGRAVPRVDYR